MNLLQNKPYQVIWLTIPLILVLGLIGMSKTLDIQLHDTYIVFATIHIGIFFSILLGLIGFLYWMFKDRKLINWMTISHVLITIIAFLLLTLTGIIFQPFIQVNIGNFDSFQYFVFILLSTFVIGQFIFLINLINSFFTNKNAE